MAASTSTLNGADTPASGQRSTQVEGLSLPGCGHWLAEECAGPLNQAVVGFLDRD